MCFSSMLYIDTNSKNEHVALLIPNVAVVVILHVCCPLEWDKRVTVFVISM
jgi:hypothetical protein